MGIIRINTYNDRRFSKCALEQHGCFLADGAPYEVVVLSDWEAVIRGADRGAYGAVIDEFRFYAPHITRFYDESGGVVAHFPAENPFVLSLSDIQPSQFYVDREKLAAVGTFINSWENIVIQVTSKDGRYIALDGHTRLYYAVTMGWSEVRAVESETDADIFGFVQEARARNIRTPYELEPVNHEEYEAKWNRFCDEYFAKLAGEQHE